MANSSLDPNTPPAQKAKFDYLTWGGLSIALIAVLFWNYTTFVGSPWSAHTDSPDCIKIMGKITDIHASGGSARKSRETYHMTFTYSVNGESFETKEQVTSNVFNRSRLGEDVEICYMKDHPDRSAVIGNDIRGEGAIYPILADVGVIVVIVMLVRDRMKRRKKAA